MEMMHGLVILDLLLPILSTLSSIMLLFVIKLFDLHRSMLLLMFFFRLIYCYGR